MNNSDRAGMDTTPEMQKHYDELWCNLTEEQRFLRGLDLICLCQQMLFAGYQSRYPDLSLIELKKIIIKAEYI